MFHWMGLELGPRRGEAPVRAAGQVGGERTERQKRGGWRAGRADDKDGTREIPDDDPSFALSLEHP